jgi:hypothetical protein
VVTFLCAAPGLGVWVLFFKIGGQTSYVLTVVACFIGWAALWFVTAPPSPLPAPAAPPAPPAAPSGTQK